MKGFVLAFGCDRTGIRYLDVRYYEKAEALCGLDANCDVVVFAIGDERIEFHRALWETVRDRIDGLFGL